MAMMYLWGRSYYDSLIGGLGFSTSMFEISLNDVMLASWGFLSVLLLLLAYISVMAPMYPMFTTAAFVFLVVPIEFIFRLFRRCRLLRRGGLRVLGYVELLVGKLPLPIRRQWDAAGTKIGLTHLLPIAFVILVYGGSVLSGSNGERHAALALKRGKRPVAVVTDQNRIVIGNLIMGIGDSVIIETEDGGRALKVAVKVKDLRQITRYPGVETVNPAAQRVPIVSTSHPPSAGP